MDNQLPPEVPTEVQVAVAEEAAEEAPPPPPPRIFYGIMFDAGSTGTRIHIYRFIQKDPGEFFVF